MILLRQPSDAQIRYFLDDQRPLPFSYPEVGASRYGAPPGYPINHHRGRLGEGAEVFARAVKAVRSWKMYDLSWTKLCWPDAPITEGTVVGVVGHHFGIWSMNACRIAYVIEEEDLLLTAGFSVVEPHRIMRTLHVPPEGLLNRPYTHGVYGSMSPQPAVRRYGFAFGTLPGHVEQGEERFTVEWHAADDSVWYEVFAFARPGPVLVRVGYPMVRLIQRRFAADSLRSMAAAVEQT